MRMSSLIRHDSRAWVAIGVFMAIAAICTCELVRAWLHGAVNTTRGFWGWIPYDAHPVWFIFVCSLYAFGLIFSAGLAFPGILALVAERRFFQRRASRPPLDDAIRGSPDPHV
jgi:hypothetical protein